MPFFFQSARAQIFILGTNPLAPFLEKSAAFFAYLLSENPGLNLTILYESDSENFGQALSLKTLFPEKPEIPLSTPADRRAGPEEQTSSKIRGLTEEILSVVPGEASKKQSRKIEDRIFIRQFNLRLPINIIRVDERLWYCITTHILPSIDSYMEVFPENELYTELLSYLASVSDPEKGGPFLSKPGEELIEVYDRKGVPRGILPRKAFYTTEFQGSAIWAFVFNRKGELLLHRRSRHTKDNRHLWDKSVGGHVDLSDRDSSVTARRELIEELFLPEAESTDPIKAFRLRAGIGDIVHLGEWTPRKRQRPEKLFGPALKELDPPDWGLFRALDEKGEPLTIPRISNRRIRGNGNNKEENKEENKE
ncbi:MAG: NUDIX domain-containing protein, partial [Methanosarcinaceae archaeon]|nr:NUDIX domain-containing protein [Methanosarcinaceae archaeon]